MKEVSFAVNSNASLEVLAVGRTRTPVIVIDDFGVDIAGMIDYACESAEYGPDTASKYPGLRARLPNTYIKLVLQQIYRLLFSVYSVPADLGLKAVNAAYSLITTPETELKPEQCRPHFDSKRPNYLAILHYLNAGPFCDTGLFRHRATGLERITEGNAVSYFKSCEAHDAAYGKPGRAYVKESNEQYELYHRVEYRPNRLVAYPGCLLHSGLVDPAVDVNSNPRTGRLTANIFVDFFPLDSQG
jgi:hypothetical protein